MAKAVLIGIAASAALTGASIAAAQPFPPTPPDQRRRVQGWLVEYAAESDGGRIVRVARQRRGVRLEFHAVFWRGNRAIYMHGSAERARLACGAEDWEQPWGTSPAAEAVRSRWTFHLLDCGTPRAQIDAALEGFDEAYAIAARWVAEAERLTEAEIEAIINYGTGDPG